MTEDEIAMVESYISKVEVGLARERGKWKARVATLEAKLRRVEAELAALRGVP